MTGLVVRRLVQMPFIILIIYTITFVLAWLIPGNPLEQPEGRRPPPEIAQAMAAQYHLDDPVTFYFDYLGKATGISWVLGLHDKPFDFGPSLQHQDQTVNRILAGSLPVSIALGLAALLLACVIGGTAGVIGAIRPGSLRDSGTLLIALIGISLPTFVTGTVLLITFAWLVPIFPVGGWGELRHIPLPAVTLSLPFAAYIARLMRYSMMDTLREDYIRTARAKGVSGAKIVLRHALRNAALPVISYLGPAAAAAMTGSFVVEKVFIVPGIGEHFVEAVLAKDLTMIMGVVLIYSTMLIVFNLLVDVCAAWLDPRIA
ncbi:MAG: ABC transporter permease [Phycisphaerales bacterium]